MNPKLVAFPAEASAEPLPLLECGNINDYNRRKHFQAISEFPSIGCYDVPRGFVGWQGVVADQHRELLLQSDVVSGYSLMRLRQYADDPSRSHPVQLFCQNTNSLKTVQHDGEVILLAKFGNAVYGHWLLDILPLAWVARVVRVSEKAKFLIIGNARTWVTEMLSYGLEIDLERVISYDDSSEVIQAEHLYVPSMLRIDQAVSCKIVDYADCLIRNIESRFAAPSELPPLIFISRAGMNSSRKAENADELATVAQSFGYKVVSPERMSWSDQVHMFANAKIVVGEHGSALHNAVFCKKSTVFGVLGHSRINWLQSSIAASRGHRLAYEWAERESVENNKFLVTYNIERFKRLLDGLGREL